MTVVRSRPLVREGSDPDLSSLSQTGAVHSLVSKKDNVLVSESSPLPCPESVRRVGPEPLAAMAKGSHYFSHIANEAVCVRQKQCQQGMAQVDSFVEAAVTLLSRRVNEMRAAAEALQELNLLASEVTSVREKVARCAHLADHLNHVLPPNPPTASSTTTPEKPY